MNNPLRILILEDSTADAKLMQYELEEAGIVFTARVVMSEKEFIQELQACTPDLILSDYDLPLYNGQSALTEAKQRCPDVPFILVTGAVTEDRAIDILTSGAKDFVMKDRLSKLSMAVQRAIEEAEEHKARKKAEAEAREASIYARSLIEASLDPLVTISADGKIMDVNRATEKATGINRDLLIGTDFANYFTEPEKARAGYEKVFLTGSVKDYLLELHHITGYTTDVLYNASTYGDDTGKVKGVFAAARDVTELKKAESELKEIQRNLDNQVKQRTAALEDEIEKRRKAEEALRKSERRERERASELEALLDAAPVPIFISNDPDSLHITGNRAAEELLRLPRGSEISLSAPIETRPRNYRAVKNGQVLSDKELPVQMAARGIPVRDFDFDLVFDDGATRHVLGYGTPLHDEKNNPRGSVIVLIDITERRDAEDALRQSRQRYRDLVTNADSIIMQMDLKGTITFFNKYAQEFFGYTLDEILGKDGRVLLPPVDREGRNLIEMIDNILKDPDAFEDNYNENIRKNGEHIWVAWKNKSIRDDNGNLIGTLSIGIDMTKFRQTEEALRKSEQRFRALLMASSDVVYCMSPDWSKIGFLESGQLVEGKEMVDSLWIQEYICPEEQPHAMKVISEAIRNRSSFELEHRIKLMDDSIGWMRTHAVPILDENGEIEEWCCAATDITHKKEAEEKAQKWLAAITEEKDRLSALVNSIADEVWFADTEKRFTLMNPSALREFRLDGNKALDVEKLAASLEVYRPDGSIRPHEEAPPLRALRGEVVRNEEEIIRTPANGALRYRQVSASPVRDGIGIIIGSVSVVRDVTDRIEAEETIKRHTAEVEAANKELDTFAYTVSHDLRAPLRAIDGFSKLLLKKAGEKLNNDEKDLINIIRGGTDKMQKLLDGLLAFSRFGREAISFATIDMFQLAEEAWKDIHHLNANRRIELTIELLPAAYGDRNLIRQVIVNLLSNAVKFTQNKDVALISIGGKSEGSENVYFVRDNGAGFDMKCYGKLFCVFNRLHSDEEYEGTGVGLAIVKRIINRHGGRVWAEGKENEGAVFYFSLPNKS